jgi:hypothetical protein
MKLSMLITKPASRNEAMNVRVSNLTHSKAIQLNQYIKYSSANHVWGKDQAMLKSNLLLVPTSINYVVLLAMGKKRKLATHLF